jgi:hypothetical protein
VKRSLPKEAPKPGKFKLAEANGAKTNGASTDAQAQADDAPAQKEGE